MTILGINDLKQYALPVGWDSTELLKFMLKDGTSYDELVNDLMVALNEKAQMMMNDPRYGGMVYVTSEQGTEVRDGVVNSMQERTEYQRADVQRGSTVGWMWPLKSYDYTLGWTFDFLRKARQTQLDADIVTALEAVSLNWEMKLLTRAFIPTEHTLGSSGKDAPFINGAGGTVDRIPPPYDGKTFATTHAHYDRKTDDATGWAAALNAGATHLKEHGFMPPYTVIWNDTDVANVRGLTGFARHDRGLAYVRTDSGMPYAIDPTLEEYYIGSFDSDEGICHIWTTAHLPADYMGMYKSYGSEDPRNPLAVREDPDMGVGPVLMRGEGFRQFPLEHALILHEFGVGVNNYLNFYACEFDSSGSYDNPTIS